MNEVDEEALDNEQDPPERDAAIPKVSPLRISLYGREGERRLSRQFNAVRLSKSQRPDLVAARGKPLIIYLNHPSWWDPLICLQIAGQFFPDRRHYGPVDAGLLSSHRFFARMGFFGVDPADPRSARRLLAIAQEILAQPDAALWIPAEARFTDPRERPVRLRSGIGHLASRARQTVLLPLALEIPFWEAQLPEALARFGEEIPAGDADLRATDWTTVLEDRLESALEALATESLARDPARFDILLAGGAEEAGMSDVWRRLKARLSGKPSLP